MVIEDYNYNDFPAVAFAARIDGRDQDTFVPAAKLVANGDCFSIVSDYLGTPMQAYDKNGRKYGSRSWTSTGGRGNGHPPSYPLSIRGSTRMRRRDCIIIVSVTTTRMQGVTSARIR